MGTKAFVMPTPKGNPSRSARTVRAHISKTAKRVKYDQKVKCDLLAGRSKRRGTLLVTQLFLKIRLMAGPMPCTGDLAQNMYLQNKRATAGVHLAAELFSAINK
jgi:hypothetical protein